MYFLRLLVALTVTVTLGSSADSGVVVTEVERTIDLASQLAKMTHKMTFNNAGSTDVKSVHFAIEQALADRVAYIGATSGASEKTYLRVTESKIADAKDAKVWSVELRKPMAKGASATIEVHVILGKAIEMLPKEIAQRDRQLALFKGNHYVYSPYKINSQTTKILLPNNNVENYSKSLKPASQQDSTITYGPYANVEPFSQSAMTVHYENNSPFLVVSRLHRTIELSMWGNIAIEEEVDIRHNGAILKGSFSRYEFQRENSGVSSVKSFMSVLPASASDVYYRDDIGNISTSALRVLDEAVELELRPRFPLFGGWKTHYVIGYNVPSYEYFYNKGDNFALNMRFVDHIYDDMLVEDFTLKIILPEGSQVGKLHTPYPVSRQADSLHFTYLDTQGRPVVTVKNIGDLTEKHIQDFQLEFVFAKSSMVREPLMLIIAFFLFFLLTIVYVRLDFSITKDEGSEAKMKLAGVCEKVLGMQEKRNQCYDNYDNALSKLKTSKDNASFQATSKKINADLKAETQTISDLVGVLKAISGDAAEKVNDLQKYDRQYRDLHVTQSQLVDKLVTGKLTKQQFIDQDAPVQRKKDETMEKISSICGQLRAF